MKKIYIAILTLISYTGFAQDKKADDSQKPPAIFVLTVDGKEYSVTEGENLKLDGSFTNPSIGVKMATYRNFDNGTVSFHYKSNSTYQYSESTGSKTWTFDGNDAVIFLFELDGAVKLDAIIDNVVKEFGKKNCKVDVVQKRIGNKMVTGKQINVVLAGQKLVQEYYELGLNNSKTNILAFQNSKKENGTISEDGLDAVELVSGSIKFEHRH
jgi:hypothetical protein